MAFPDLTPQSELGLTNCITSARVPSLPWFETLAFLCMILITHHS